MAGQLVSYNPSSPAVAHFREERYRSQKVSYSSTKLLERRLVRAWKRVTRSMRRQERASIIPEGFVLMNARRRSMFLSAA
ncbi:hypothetical protein BV25DRAFT_1993892 [Artomyces pyxidatus]|uniref:Uncharacterized protein n=1 Tax=Artomyces pyxidatus TaxID=48021 RepID=A0ACB8SSW4_9AGAM|nr:hypothetical protein BV25DRAFT_1993892 [Artomyces pyxidatus]